MRWVALPVILAAAVVASPFVALWLMKHHMRTRAIRAGLVASQRPKLLCDWEMSRSADGRIAHLIPRDDTAHDDHWPSGCECSPTIGNYTTDAGDNGWMYIHRPRRSGR